jgi:vancomycin permeability regulator SanA
MTRRTKRLLAVIATGALAPFLGTMTAIAIDGLTDEIAPSDVALILGNKVNPDGSLSGRLQGRLNRGIALYESHLVRKVMVSGGLGKEGHLEGDVMAQYLHSHGIPASSILIDNQGTTTWATAENYKKMHDAHGFESVIVVSQFFHLSRSRLALEKQGVRNIGTAHAQYFELRDSYATIREVPAYLKYCLMK